jgi:CubicO group peptidase (beta-lactamase class C family)
MPDALPSFLLQAIADKVAATATEHHCPTIAWGIVVDGHLAHSGSTGTLPDGREPSEHTVYRIASMTKSFTAAAVLSLRDEGVLGLDDQIVRHAPELNVVAPAVTDAPAIRVRDLLSMSAGMATDDAWADRHLDITDDELDAAIASGVLFTGTPGDTYEYSNLGYGLLGRVVKRASGRRVQDLISERLLGPLEMSRSTWVMPDHDDWARPFAERDGHAVADHDEPLGDGEIAPMGGIWTTVSDLARWIMWLDDAHPARSTVDMGPLCRASRREMQQMHRYIGMVEFAGRTIAAGYGLGLRVRDDPRLGRVITHSGGVPGYGSNMRWLAGRRFGVIALANVTYAPMADLTEAILEILADHDELPAQAHQPSELVEQMGRRLVNLLQHWDDRVADELFADNVGRDQPIDRRRADAARWVQASNGVLQIDHVLTVSASSGDVIICRPDGRPSLTLEFQIGPLLPHKIQHYEGVEG